MRSARRMLGSGRDFRLRIVLMMSLFRSTASLWYPHGTPSLGWTVCALVIWVDHFGKVGYTVQKVAHRRYREGMTEHKLTFRSRRIGRGRVAHDCWLEVPYGEGWIAAYRLAPQEGRLVLAELRIFPRSTDEPKAGEWEAEADGYLAEVPPGGLTARMVKTVKPGEFSELAREILRCHGADVGFQADARTLRTRWHLRSARTDPGHAAERSA